MSADVKRVQELRAAFMYGATRMHIETRETERLDVGMRDLMERAARARYPMPPVEVPRVVEDAAGYRWRLMGGALQWKRSGEESAWRNTDSAWCPSVTVDRVRTLSQLLDSPTVTVFADDPRASDLTSSPALAAQGAP